MFQLKHEGKGCCPTHATASRFREDDARALISPRLMGAQLLAERLRGEQSFFHPYISQLPVGFQGIPMFFGPQAMAALQYQPVISQVPAPKYQCSGTTFVTIQHQPWGT